MNNREIKIETYHCPTCNSDNYQEIEKNQAFKINVGICRYCGFIYRQKYFTQSVWENFAKYHHKQPPNHDYFVSDTHKCDHLSSIFPEVFTKEKRILDIGIKCGQSFERLNVTTGLELSLYHYSVAKELTTGDVRNTYKLEDENFDIIVMYNTLSLIPNPHNYLKSLHKKLKIGGVLIIGEMPINFCHSQNMGGGLDRAKYTFFTDKSLKNLLNSQGFRLETSNKNHHTFLYSFTKGNTDPIQRDYEGSEYLFNSYLKCVDIYLKDANKNNKTPGKYLKTLYGKQPHCLEGYFAKLHDTSGDDAALFLILDEIEKKFPNFVPALAFIGQVYNQHELFEKSLDYFNTCLKTAKSFDLWEWAGLNYYKLGIYDESIRCYLEAKKINPMSVGNNFNLFMQSAAYRIHKHD